MSSFFAGILTGSMINVHLLIQDSETNLTCCSEAPIGFVSYKISS
jgi:hypothetical protein